MARSVMLAATALALCLLQSVPSLAWYKPAVGRGHYSVGRAAGLLSGLRRVPLAQRSESPLGTSGPKSLTVCVQDVAPNLRSCSRLRQDSTTFQCKAEVFLSLRAPGQSGCPGP